MKTDLPLSKGRPSFLIIEIIYRQTKLIILCKHLMKESYWFIELNSW